MPIPRFSKAHHFSQFATSSRLLSCLVTEGLASAYVMTLPSHPVEELKALCIIVYEHSVHFEAGDIHSVVLLKGIPITETSTSANGLCKVKLLDPMDMLPAIYTLKYGKCSEASG